MERSHSGKVLKKLLWSLGIVAAVVIVGLALVIWNLDRLVKFGVETGGSSVLGVETTLDRASVSLLAGTLGLHGLKLGSPEGFSAAEMFSLDHGHTRADIWSLWGNEVVVREVTIDGADIALEFRGLNTNWGALMARLKKKPSEEEAESKKRFRVDRIVFTNCWVRIAGLPVVKSVPIPLPDLEIKDLHGSDGTGVRARKLVTAVCGSLYGSVLGAVEGVVPTKEIARLTRELKSVLGEVGGIVGEVAAPAGEIIKGGATEAKKLLDGILGN